MVVTARSWWDNSTPHNSVNVEHRLSSTLHGHQIEATYRLHRLILIALIDNRIQRVHSAPRTAITNSQGDFTENGEHIAPYIYNPHIFHSFSFIVSEALNLSHVFGGTDWSQKYDLRMFGRVGTRGKTRYAYPRSYNIPSWPDIEKIGEAQNCFGISRIPGLSLPIWETRID